jgi:hypothetical protein
MSTQRSAARGTFNSCCDYMVVVIATAAGDVLACTAHKCKHLILTALHQSLVQHVYCSANDLACLISSTEQPYQILRRIVI